MIRFILENLIDSATLTDSPSSDTSYPVDNITKVHRSEVCRSVSTPAIQSYLGNWSTDKTASALVIGRHNFSQYVSYQLILYDGINQTGSEVFNSGVIQLTYSEAATDYIQWGEFRWGIKPWDYNKKDVENIQFKNIVLWFPLTTFRSCKIAFSGPTGTVDAVYCNSQDVFCNSISVFCNDSGTTTSQDIGIPFYEVGRIFLGEYLEPTYNISFDHSISWQENTTQYRAGSGTLKSDITTKNKRFTFDLNTIPESDRIGIQKKLVNLGLTKDFFISIFPEDTNSDKVLDYSGIVKLTRVPRYTEVRCGYYKSNYVAEEV